jgi:hypothetical protein
MQKWPAHQRLLAWLEEHGSLPTPTAKTYGYNKGGAAGRVGRERPSIETLCLPTPTARDWKSGKASDATMARNSRPLNEHAERAGVRGLNFLTLREWMMDWPIGWSIASERLETAKFQSWLQQHSRFWTTH